MIKLKVIHRAAILIGVLWVLGGLFSCSKDAFYNGSDKVLKFSMDTVMIDTVFTTLGSATASVKIYNTSNESVKISSIQFANAAQTAFKINVDGISGSIINDVEIGAKDSMYVFAKVTIDPKGASTSILVEEAIEINYNNVTQYVVFSALGIDAYFHYGEFITENTVWKTDKPHVVLERTIKDTFYPGIIIPSGVTLTMPAGSKVFFNSQAGILCGGTLKIEGTRSDSVVLRGIRLTKSYIHNAGAWLGLMYLRNSKNNTIKYAYVDESILGIYMGFQTDLNFEAMTDNTRAEIFIANSFIKNAYYFTLRSMNNKIKAENSVFFTSTDNLCQLTLGGDYEFNNCTFYNSQSPKKKELLALTNFVYYEPTGTTYKANLTKASFVNCVWGTTFDESIYVGMKDGADSNYSFTNCLYYSKTNFKTDRFNSCKNEAVVKFKNTAPDREDFHLTAGSPCIDAGISNGIPTDIEDKPRNGIYDIGAYEF
jgi:hypothetical protein